MSDSTSVWSISFETLIGYGVLSRRLCYMGWVAGAALYLFGLGYRAALGLNFGLSFFCVLVVTLILLLVGVIERFPKTFYEASADLPRFSEDMPLNIIRVRIVYINTQFHLYLKGYG